MPENSPFSVQTTWFKFTDYEIVEDLAGRPCIVPTRYSACTDYRPFDGDWAGPKGIFVEFLELGRNVSAIEPTCERELEQASELVMGFCKKWGLLGLFWRYLEGYSNEVIVGYNKYLAIWGVFPSAPYEQYAECFFPRGEVHNPYEIVLPDPDEDRRFQEEMGEPVVMVAHEALQLYRQMVRLDQFKHSTDKPKLDDLWDDTLDFPEGSLRSLFEGFAVDQVSLVPVVEEKTKAVRMDYRFGSLIGALRLMFLFNITETSHPVRTCVLDSCQKVFIAKKWNQKGCTPQHANNERVRRLRTKRRT